MLSNIYGVVNMIPNTIVTH